MDDGSITIDSKIKDDLEREARLQNVSADDLAQRAIKGYLAYQEREREILRERVAEADKGVFVSSEAVLDWMAKLERDPTAPFPEPDTFLPPRA
jgi:predicted transcriptional regulator